MNNGMLSVWFLAYVFPAAAAGAIAFIWPRKEAAPKRDVLIMHAALLVSIAASQYEIHARGLAFPWHTGQPSLAACAVAIGLACVLIGRLGLWYFLSAFVQELTMLSIAFLLLPAFPVYAVILLIVPIFVACHFLTFDHLRAKIILIPLWGVASILLFVATQNIWLIAALHAVLGSFLFSRSVLGSGMYAENPGIRLLPKKV